MSTKLLIGASIIILLMIGTISVLTYKLKEVKVDRDRITLNFQNTKNEMDSSYNSTVEAYVYKVQSLQLKDKELKEYNKELTDKVENLGIKVKNLNGVITTKMAYIINLENQKDSDKPGTGIVTNKINDTLFQASYSDRYVSMEQLISVKDEGNHVTVDSLDLQVYADVDFIEEINYKGWWFWKKATDITLHVVSENKYLKLEEVRKYNLLSKKGKSK